MILRRQSLLAWRWHTRWQNESLAIRWLAIALMLLSTFAAVPAVAKLAGVTASQAEIRAGWQRFRDRETNLIPQARFPHQACFEASSARHDIPLSLLLAVARGESNFDPRAVSKADARGLMQILWPGTAKHLGIVDEARLFDPCTNVDAGARYLVELMQRYDGDVHLALAAYNYGPGRIAPDAVVVQEGAAWYSGYIYNHLRYVLGTASSEAARRAPANYADEKSQIIITFHDPRRAESFVSYLRDQVPQARLDWFDRGLGRYSVVLLYQDEREYASSREYLAASGFTVSDR